MKKTMAVMLTSVILLFVGATGALATHKADHPGPACAKSGNPTAGNSGQACRYPPGQAKQNTSGSPSSFSTEAGQSGGVTVGMVTLGAIGALGVLMVARRRWAFRPDRG